MHIKAGSVIFKQNLNYFFWFFSLFVEKLLSISSTVSPKHEAEKLWQTVKNISMSPLSPGVFDFLKLRIFNTRRY